ncbi:hypothetical protein LTR08_002986 [Meristemomyces frigidus]|nr:hypothetical protein LTR08_002986 [Meristemomyces frigidus]
MPDSLPLSTLRASKSTPTPTPTSHRLPPDYATSPAASSSDLVHLSHDTSRQPSPLAALPHPDQYKKGGPEDSDAEDSDAEDSDSEPWDAADDDDNADSADPPTMSSSQRRSSIRPMDSRAQAPLLSPGHKHNDYERPQSPALSRRRSSRFRERDPAQRARAANKKRYTYAAAFLGLSLVTFAIQTETAVYIQHNLHWNKAYCMLYFTHGSWALLYPTQLLIVRLQHLSEPWPLFWRHHTAHLRLTAQMIQHRTLHPTPLQRRKSPIPFFLRTTAFVTCALTVAGGSWYVAVNLTTASDLTAIYNCSAFFAYAFAIPMLHEQLRWSKVVAVIIAITGVLVVAYGDTAAPKHGSKSGGGAGGPSAPPDHEAANRALGNLVIGIGSVLYGFYEVLYKKVACPPDGCSPTRGMLFATTFGSMMGVFTLLVLWIPLPLLHILGWETFQLPTGRAAWMLAISVLANATFSGSFLVLISLTSPVLSSVAALLTIFLVALCDQVLPPPLYQPLTGAAVAGGVLIIGAFLLLSWATFREMAEERRRAGHGGEEFLEEGSESGGE